MVNRTAQRGGPEHALVGLGLHRSVCLNIVFLILFILYGPQMGSPDNKALSALRLFMYHNINDANCCHLCCSCTEHE